MRRARQNPADLNPLKLRIEEVVSKAMSVLITEERATMPFWQKVEKTGPVAAEMELMRMFAGDWQPKAPYGNVRSLTIEVPSYIAFTYCAERANRAAGNHQIADAFWFMRHTDSVKNALEERPAKGGLRALIIATRMRLSQVPVFCTEDQLDFQRPEDALVFARSSMWGAYSGTGWKQVVDPLVKKHTKRAARRGHEVTVTQIKSGVTAAGGKPVGMSFAKADLRDADMRKYQIRTYKENANLEGAKLQGANFDGADFGGAKLTGANFTGASGVGARMMGSSLYNANFTGAKLGGARLDYARADSVNFTRADLTDANLTDANFMNAKLVNANLEGANLRYATFRRANLEGANLSESDLTLATLYNANFTGADLARANLDGADLSGTTLTGAKREETDHAIPGWRIVSGLLQRA